MSFCSICGNPVSNNNRFCVRCGSPIGNRNAEDNTRRRQEYAGKIVKCPSCGTEISSFTAICPGCGHEINSPGVSSIFRSFTDQISECDRFIAYNTFEPQKGWKYWSIGKKIGWVILNLYTLCVPLLIYWLIPFLGMGSMTTFTPEEKRKASIIDNFPFPMIERLFWNYYYL